VDPANEGLPTAELGMSQQSVNFLLKNNMKEQMLTIKTLKTNQPIQLERVLDS
jgi:hypothetical protein